MKKTQEWWDRYFLEMARHVSTASKDPSTKVGAVLVNPKNNRVISVGYNGFAQGVTDSEERYNDRELKYKLVVHGETNALLMAGDRALGSRLYVWPSFMLPPVCCDCCKIAIQAGVSEIVGYVVDDDKLDARQSRWKESILLSRMMCEEAGVGFRGIKDGPTVG